MVGDRTTIIEGLAREAVVTSISREALVLGFELTDGAKSMADIILGKVSLDTSRHSLMLTVIAQKSLVKRFLMLCAAACGALSGLRSVQALVDDARVGQQSTGHTPRDTIPAAGGRERRSLCHCAAPH